MDKIYEKHQMKAYQFLADEDKSDDEYDPAFSYVPIVKKRRISEEVFEE